MVTNTMTKAEAEELFQREAILFDRDAVPEYRVMELFGQGAADFIGLVLSHDGYLKGGVDWNAWGSCDPGRPMVYYYYLPGFLKIVTENNYLLTVEQHKNSKGGTLSDKMWEERTKRIDGKKKKKGGESA